MWEIPNSSIVPYAKNTLLQQKCMHSRDIVLNMFMCKIYTKVADVVEVGIRTFSGAVHSV